MNVTANHYKDHAFVLRRDDVLRLWEMLEKQVGTVTATAECKDSLERSFNSADALLKYENPKSRSITTLNLKARSNDRNTSINIELGDNFRTLRWRAEGNEEKIIVLKGWLDDFFDGIRPWFSPVTKIDFFVIGMAFLFLFLIFIQLISDPSKSHKPMETGAAINVTLLLVASLLGLFFLIWGLHRLRSRLFPKITFAIGQGEARFQFDENIRWTVIIGLLVSIIASSIWDTFKIHSTT